MTYIIQGSFQLQNTTNHALNLFPIHFRRRKWNNIFLIKKDMLLLIWFWLWSNQKYTWDIQLNVHSVQSSQL